MKEFEESQLEQLIKVDGLLLQNVHGKEVAIGKGLKYENIQSFISEYFLYYGVEDFIKHIQNIEKMTSKEWRGFAYYVLTEFPNPTDVTDICYYAFDGKWGSELKEELEKIRNEVMKEINYGIE